MRQMSGYARFYPGPLPGKGEAASPVGQLALSLHAPRFMAVVELSRSIYFEQPLMCKVKLSFRQNLLKFVLLG